MTTHKIYDIPKPTRPPLITEEMYEDMYQRSINDPEKFWAEHAKKFITWNQPWHTTMSGDFNEVDIHWFAGGKLNACYNCIDRHLEKRADQVALIWESEDPDKSLHLTYAQLHREICKFSNVLKKIGVKKGDRVCIYMPMLPEAVVAMLACARIGAIHSVVYSGFSPDALKKRILDADCHVVVTADQGLQAGKTVPLKKNTDIALLNCPNVRQVIVVKRTGNIVPWVIGRDIYYHQIMANVDAHCPLEVMDAEDPLFVLYTSGSTGTPKGIVHATGGYLVFVSVTYKYVFDYHEGDIHWCTGDLGGITAHSYVIYGPLANGAATLIHEGKFDYPTSIRYCEIIEKHRVNIFYTRPSKVDVLRSSKDELIKKTDRTSLRLLGTVGEGINPDLWEWFYTVFGNGRCPIVNTWWQTEGGGIMISPLPFATKVKPGSVAKPFFGIIPAIVNDNGQKVDSNQIGKLVITKPWPGLAKSIYGNHQMFINEYFRQFPGYYFTADGAYCDSDGYYWITEREDDLMIVSGHRVDSCEVENVLLSYQQVAEAAVFGVSHPTEGQVIYAYVVVKKGVETSEALKQDLIKSVQETIGAIATPREIRFVSGLPRTRTGKMMRRILRKIENNEFENLGDISTLAEPRVIDELIDLKKKLIKK